MSGVGNDEIVARFSETIADLRPASRWALAAALMAMESEGVGGSLVIQIPRRGRDLLDVAFVAGTTRLVLEA